MMFTHVVRGSPIGEPISEDWRRMRQIKEWAATRLGADAALRRVLEREPEKIRAGEFVVKLGVWPQLLEIEGESQ
jgi:hypothetical protein